LRRNDVADLTAAFRTDTRRPDRQTHLTRSAGTGRRHLSRKKGRSSDGRCGPRYWHETPEIKSANAISNWVYGC